MSIIPDKYYLTFIERNLEYINLTNIENDNFDFSNVDLVSADIYEIYFIILLVLLSKTKPLLEGSSSGLSLVPEDIDYGKTINSNALSTGYCYSYTGCYKKIWRTDIHDLFLQTLRICYNNCSSTFLKTYEKNIQSLNK